MAGRRRRSNIGRSTVNASRLRAARAEESSTEREARLSQLRDKHRAERARESYAKRQAQLRQNWDIHRIQSARETATISVQQIVEEAFKQTKENNTESKINPSQNKPIEYKPPKIPTSNEYKEQLYEFGKFVAEQLMTLSEVDAKAAQTEIEEVLKTYRPKYKIINSLTKPALIAPTTAVTNQSKQIKANLLSKTQPMQQVPPETQPNHYGRRKITVIENPIKSKNIIKIKAVPQTSTQNVIQQSMFSSKPSAGDVPVSLVIVPSENGGLKLTSALIDSETIINFPSALQVNMENSILNIHSPIVSNTGSVKSQPSNYQASVGIPGVALKATSSVKIPELGLIDAPSLCHAEVDPLKLDSEIKSEPMEPVSEIQCSGLTGDDTETVEFKCEPNSDEDEDKIDFKTFT